MKFCQNIRKYLYIFFSLSLLIGEEKIDTVLSELWTKATKEEKNLYHEKSTSILKVQDANESADEAIETPVASPMVNGNAKDKIQVSAGSKRGRKSKNQLDNGLWVLNLQIVWTKKKTDPSLKVVRAASRSY